MGYVERMTKQRKNELAAERNQKHAGSRDLYMHQKRNQN